MLLIIFSLYLALFKKIVTAGVNSHSIWRNFTSWKEWISQPEWKFEANEWIGVNVTNFIHNSDANNITTKYFFTKNPEFMRIKEKGDFIELNSTNGLLKRWFKTLWVYIISLVPNNTVTIELTRGATVNEIISIMTDNQTGIGRFKNKDLTTWEADSLKLTADPANFIAISIVSLTNESSYSLKILQPNTANEFRSGLLIQKFLIFNLIYYL